MKHENSKENQNENIMAAREMFFINFYQLINSSL